MAFGKGAGGILQLYGENLQYGEDIRQLRQLEREENLSAAQLGKQARFTAKKGRQAIQDLGIERGETLGTIRAGQAKAGIKATGSAALRSKRTASRYDQRIERVGEDVRFAVEEIEFEAKRRRRQGREFGRQRDFARRARPFQILGSVTSIGSSFFSD